MKTSSRPQLLTLALLVLGAAPIFGSEPASTADRPPQTLSTVTPAVPYLLRRAEGTAEVTVSFTVNSKGVVTKASVLDSNNIEFNAATLDAIKKWTFTPAMKDGKAVDARMQQTVTFSVQDKPTVSLAPLVAADKLPSNKAGKTASGR